MKMRQGFVSNSSTSSFVIALDRSYQLTEQEMKYVRDFNKELSEKQFKKEFKKGFEALCSKSSWLYGDCMEDSTTLSDVGQSIVWALIDSHNPRAIDIIHMSVGGWNCVHNILADDLKKKIKKE